MYSSAMWLKIAAAIQTYVSSLVAQDSLSHVTHRPSPTRLDTSIHTSPICFTNEAVHTHHHHHRSREDRWPPDSVPEPTASLTAGHHRHKHKPLSLSRHSVKHSQNTHRHTQTERDTPTHTHAHRHICIHKHTNIGQCMEVSWPLDWPPLDLWLDRPLLWLPEWVVPPPSRDVTWGDSAIVLIDLTDLMSEQQMINRDVRIRYIGNNNFLNQWWPLTK